LPSKTIQKQSFLSDLLVVAARFTALAVSRIYAGKLRSSEWRVLVALGQSGTLTVKTIAEQSQITKTKVSRAVTKLKQRKLVSRNVNKADLREAFISLTPAGQALYDELAPIAKIFETQILDALDPSDRAALNRALYRITERSKQLIGSDLPAETPSLVPASGAQDGATS
jgi:DNA-binding MarR family transcriptional regulator